MEVMTIDSPAYKELLARLKSIETSFQHMIENSALPLGERWMDNHDVCKELNICLRTLQYYRDHSLLPYTTVRQKKFYRASDVQKMMMTNYQDIKPRTVKKHRNARKKKY